MASIFSLTLFSREHVEYTKTGLLEEQAYAAIPEYVFKHTDWFYNSAKDTKANLETLLLGESYRVAWSRDQANHILITKTSDPSSIIVIDNNNTNVSLVQRSPSIAPLPPSDDEDEKDKSVTYKMICSRYSQMVFNWAEDFLVTLTKNNKKSLITAGEHTVIRD